MSNKVVLAYSGGLDTSVILMWLLEQGYDVIAYIADVGQQQDFDQAREQALRIGASKVFIEDLKEEFINDFIFPICKANAIYEGRYLLGTAIARPLIAKRQIELAQQEQAAYVAHGATGKGNDQVRFELSYYALQPSIKVLAPWKMASFLAQFTGRDDMLSYVEKHGIKLSVSRSRPYSEDENLMHISHEAGILEDPSFPCPEEIYSRSCSPLAAPDKQTILEIEFKDGLPICVRNCDTGEEHRQSLALFNYLNQIGRENGVGRLDMVENRFVGLKSRGIYEAPGATILHTAHLDLEGIAMDREVMRLRDMLAVKMAELVYNGFWFSPEFDFIRAAIDRSQDVIDGTVKLSIYKGNVYPISRTSPSSLYDPDLSSMNTAGGYDQQDAAGFIQINAIRLMAHRWIVDSRHAKDRDK